MMVEHEAAAGVSIRDAEAGDEAAWRALWAGYLDFYRSTLGPEVTAETWRRILDPDGPIRARMAVLDGRVVGFAICIIHASTWSLAPRCYLEDLFVAPEARGAGVGKALLDDLVAIARARGFDALYWHTQSGNETARRLYDRFGPADDFVRYRLRFG